MHQSLKQEQIESILEAIPNLTHMTTKQKARIVRILKNQKESELKWTKRLSSVAFIQCLTLSIYCFTYWAISNLEPEKFKFELLNDVIGELRHLKDPTNVLIVLIGLMILTNLAFFILVFLCNDESKIFDKPFK